MYGICMHVRETYIFCLGQFNKMAFKKAHMGFEFEPRVQTNFI